jgi:hypothetical protein
VRLIRLGLLLFVCLVAQAQRLPGSGAVRSEPLWRRNFTGFLGQPAANLGMRDIERFENYLLYAAPYCAMLAASEIAENRDLARRMTTYLGTVNTTSADSSTRAAAMRASRSVAAFPCAFSTGQPPPVAVPAAQLADPPFSLQAPALENVSAADKEVASDLQSRYAADAIKAALAWRNAEMMRVSLAARNMSLNAQTAASVGHFQLFLDQASAALRDRKWDEAQGRLQAVEAETQKVVNVVGH